MKELICIEEISGGIGMQPIYVPERELVRCKNCKHKGIVHECIMDRVLQECGATRTQVFDYWFCANGERSSDQ